MVLLWNVLHSLSTVIDSFDGFTSLDWHLWSLRVYRVSVQALLTFRVSTEKSGAVVMALPLEKA